MSDNVTKCFAEICLANEARCKRLEAALRSALDESDLPDGNRARMRDIMRNALSDTAQQETGNADFCEGFWAGKTHGQDIMREDAAQEIESLPNHTTAQIAARVRGLPLLHRDGEPRVSTAAGMRERAAKLIRGMEANGFDPRRFVDQIADAVDALPLDPETGGE